MIVPFFRQTPLLSVLMAVFVSACSHVRTPTQRSTPMGPPAPTDQLGPPEPVSVFGPQTPQARKVVLFLAAGVPGALGGAGVIRALEEAKIQVAAIVGIELGALVGAAYALAENANGMDWRLLQLKPETLSPSRGLGSFLGSGRNARERLIEGMDKIFSKTDLSRARLPIWILVDRGGVTQAVAQGPVAKLMVGALSHPDLAAPGEEGQSAKSWGNTLELLSAEGLSLPGVWVVPKIPQEWPMEAAAKANQDASRWLRPNDLWIELESGKPWEFSRRSDLIYAAKKKTRALLPQWRMSLGWDGEPK